MVGITIALLFGLFKQMTGCFLFTTYSVLIFEKSGSTMDPYLSSIIMVMLQICGCFAQLYLLIRLVENR